MTGAAALALILPIIGGAIPATIAAVMAYLGQRQLARAEWSKRLEAALERIASEDPTQRRIGQDLLRDLIGSNLGSASDRALALNIATTAVRASVALDQPTTASKIEPTEEKST